MLPLAVSVEIVALAGADNAGPNPDELLLLTVEIDSLYGAKATAFAAKGFCSSLGLGTSDPTVRVRCRVL